VPEPCQEMLLQVAVSYQEVGLKEFVSLFEPHMSGAFLFSLCCILFSLQSSNYPKLHCDKQAETLSPNASNA